MPGPYTAAPTRQARRSVSAMGPAPPWLRCIVRVPIADVGAVGGGSRLRAVRFPSCLLPCANEAAESFATSQSDPSRAGSGDPPAPDSEGLPRHSGAPRCSSPASRMVPSPRFGATLRSSRWSSSPSSAPSARRPRRAAVAIVVGVNYIACMGTLHPPLRCIPQGGEEGCHGDAAWERVGPMLACVAVEPGAVWTGVGDADLGVVAA